MRRRSPALLPLVGWLLLSSAVPCRSQEEDETLLPGPPHERPIAEGETHVYRVEAGEEPVLVLSSNRASTSSSRPGSPRGGRC
jgi:hypothetical protein